MSIGIGYEYYLKQSLEYNSGVDTLWLMEGGYHLGIIKLMMDLKVCSSGALRSSTGIIYTLNTLKFSTNIEILF